MPITRREFVRLTITLALTSLSGRGSAAGNAAVMADSSDKLLFDISYQLFPHEHLSRKVYKQVAAQLNDKINQSPELLASAENALATLAGNDGHNWSELPQTGQATALATIQHTPFFQFVLNETLSGIYRHPLTWELLGFEGSSLEFGGYINRGLSDIDWLPE